MVVKEEMYSTCSKKERKKWKGHTRPKDPAKMDNQNKKQQKFSILFRKNWQQLQKYSVDCNAFMWLVTHTIHFKKRNVDVLQGMQNIRKQRKQVDNIF